MPVTRHSQAPSLPPRAALAQEEPHLTAVPPLEERAPTPAPVTRVRAPRTVFDRFEFKYWMPEPIAAQVLTFAEPYLVRDPFALTKDSSRNVTLYLDTRGYTFYRMHEALSPDRIKLRVRGYGHPVRDIAFVEIKRKVKTMTTKQRVKVPLDSVRDVLSGRIDMVRESERPKLDAFVRAMKTFRASPKIIVSCYREAFESRIIGQDVRVTFDREISYQPALGPDLSFDPHRWRIVGDGDPRPSFGRGRVLLELKFGGAQPSWFAEVVSRFGLVREAYSKYTTCVRAMTRRRGT